MKYYSAIEGMNKLLIHVTLWTNLKDTVASERNQ